MSTSSINFNNKKKLKKRIFTTKKKIFNINDIDINKIFISKKETYGKYNSCKYFIGCNDKDVLDHYTYLFHKRLAILINLIKIK